MSLMESKSDIFEECKTKFLKTFQVGYSNIKYIQEAF